MATPAPPHPRVGVAAIVCNAKGELVMGKRAGSHGSGTWAFPGGHLEMTESFIECAERETLEETGLRVRGTGVVAVTNDVFDGAKHYITIFVRCEMIERDAQPEILEPDKCEGWHWMRWEDVRRWCEHHDDEAAEWSGERCFLPIRNLVREHPQLDLSR
ncbi:Uu.00g032590.m01.CDS01 [Anthostomella pinea]|uniref:Uu.00g032590.m01.CDS01 n=1 Tax=Anthostomella pinea TaxID=933095 RepID=A0AAI8V8Q2_9PEZI|nr:Uu.00g032590.m01.CDS01 [Anthostomella pinea]